MRKKKECIAMLLAGGQGSRLGLLTRHIAKPAVSFGGKYRIIDFSLSNCANSDIDTVGVLTQYRPFRLNSHIGTGSSWDLDISGGGVYILPPYATEKGGQWYQGTADAIYQNLDFIDTYDPDYVLILSGDHLYRMDYRKMLSSHIAHNAEVTISVMQVAWEEASRFGIITAESDGRIAKFSEKPKEPDSNLASMGIYIFNRDLLKKALMEDSTDPDSDHDFGKNIIPKLLHEGRRLYTYEFSGFWKDVGTIQSFHETSMGLLDKDPAFTLSMPDFPIMSNADIQPPHYVGPNASVEESIVANGTRIYGTVKHCVISGDILIEDGAYIKDSVVLPGAVIKKGARIVRSIIGENTVIEENAVVGSDDPSSEICVIGDEFTPAGGMKNG